MSQNDFDEQPGEEGRPQGRLRGILGWVVIVVLTFLLAYLFFYWPGNAKEFSREQLEQLFAKPDAVSDLYIQGTTLHGKIKSGVRERVRRPAVHGAVAARWKWRR